MARDRRLGEGDRKLFALVSAAAYANPFGEHRSSLDAAITEAQAGEPGWTPRMLQRVGARLSALHVAGHLDVRDFGERDRVLVEDTVLFEAFHRILPALDAYISAQERALDAPLKLTAARSFLREICERGIPAQRAQRMLELSYQLRRAFYFISRGLVGDSACMRQLREALWEAVFTRDIRRYERHLWNRMEDFSTIIVGETGTGKGAAAAAIGLSGFIPWNEKSESFAHHLQDTFLPIHLNEFPESLFESEIFGHRKGAFTGAVDNYEGALSRCRQHASVFFDEIGEATLPVQVKLLRVLQERVFTPVGSREYKRFAGRILAATHRSLSELRAQGALRDDFFYRLCSNMIEVPPLRVRLAQAPAELAQLVRHLCARITGSDDSSLVEEVTAAIERDLGADYPFPGNVRELEQCVRRVLLTGACARDERRLPGPQHALMRELTDANLTAEALLQRYCAALHARHPNFVEVARITGLDRRTVKKYVEGHATKTA